MKIASRQGWGYLCIAGILINSMGCRTQNEFRFQNPPHGYRQPSTEIEVPNLPLEYASEAIDAQPPLTLSSEEPTEFWPLTLADTIRLTLESSEVMRDLGARVVTGPAGSPTVYDPAIQQVDPRGGVEAALSAFDAQVDASLLFNRNERTLNNLFVGGGTVSLAQNSGDFNAQVSKRAATGTQFVLRNITNYNRNNVPSNRFASFYDTVLQTEFTHPLLRGGGLDFNRIAGPNAAPGGYGGVVIARINTDIALADFELAIRNHLRAVEETYWQLYFAYRNLDALQAGRRATLNTWERIKNELEVGTKSPLEEATAREQYFLAHAQVQTALTGTDGGQVGVYSVERTLRSLMGLTATDGRLIRPADEPLMAKAVFDWDESVRKSLDRRVELRRQRWTIQQRQLELQAARNYALSRLDVIGRYSWRGFGDDLFGNRDAVNGSAAADLFNGDLQDWQLGLQFSTPIGNRIGHAAIRHAELQLARDRAREREQQRQIVTDLSSSFGELVRSRSVSRTNYNRGLAARERLEKAEDRYRVGATLVEFVLEAQQRVVTADSDYYRALTDYTTAVSGVHLARGTYLSYLGVSLTEGPWSAGTQRLAAKEAHRWGPRRLSNYCIMQPGVVSQGPYQQTDLQEVVVESDQIIDTLPAPAPNP